MQYVLQEPPREALDRLALYGYRVLCSSGLGQTVIWTLFKP